MQNNEFKKDRIKVVLVIIFDDVVKLGDFDLHNILIKEKSHENIFMYVFIYFDIFYIKL